MCRMVFLRPLTPTRSQRLMIAMSTQAEILRTRYRDMRERGVLDLKISFAPLAEETTESVCGSINEALEAIESGEFHDLLPMGDSRRP